MPATTGRTTRRLHIERLMLHFVQLGLGLAIVNVCCRLPTGVIARSLPTLPTIHYQLFHLHRTLPKPVAQLKHILLANAARWKD